MFRRFGLLLGVAVALAPLATPRADAAEVVGLQVPAAIDATGNSDVTDLLNVFMARLGPGVTVTFPVGARYRIDGTLELRNRRGVTIDGTGATFFAPTDGSDVPPPRRGARAHWPRLRAQWRIRGGSGITMRNVTVRGANPNGGATAAAYVPALEGQAGIVVQRASGVVLDAVHISDTYGDAVYVTGGSTDVTIRASTLERTGRQGVAVVNGQRIVVEDNEIRGVARSVFDLEPVGRDLAQDIRLRNNTIGDYTNFLLAAGGSGPGVNDIWLEGNEVAGGNGVSVYAGVELRRRTNYHILDNTGTGRAQPPAGTGRPGLLQLLNLDGVEIRGNEQPVAGGPAISLDRVCGATVQSNDFPGATREQQVIRACGAAAPSPNTGAAPSAPPTTAVTAPPPGSDGGDDTGSLVAAVAVGFAGGLAVAFAGFVLWRRRRSGRVD